MAGTTRRMARSDVVGAVSVLAVAAVLFTRFDLYTKMVRDSSIYIYGGQQVIHGLPPYASEMDPKGPMSSIIAGFGVAAARLLGRSDVLVVRAGFCALAVLGVLGIYLLVLELWHSVAAAVVAAVVFTSFKNFAFNAMTATDGHMPGIVFLIFAMWLTVRRSWYSAGFLAALAFLTWQPLFVYPLVTLICAVAWSPEQRLRTVGRTVAGMATPFLVLVIYYAVEGYPKDLFLGLFVYPLTGVYRPPTTVGHRLHAFVTSIDHGNEWAAILFWLGLALMVLAAIWTVGSARSRWREAMLKPIVLVILLSFVVDFAYVLYDFIGYPHTWPILPYASVGIGAATAALLDGLSKLRIRRAATAVLLVAAAGLTVSCAVNFSRPLPSAGELLAQQASACALQRSLVPGTPLWVIDDPVSLVLLKRRNPDNFPYVGGGLDVWKVDHTPGGFAGWMRQIASSRASIVDVDAWLTGRYKQSIKHWLHIHYYRHGFIGGWHVYVSSAARRQMRAHGIALLHERGVWPLKTDGTRFTNTHCAGAAA